MKKERFGTRRFGKRWLAHTGLWLAALIMVTGCSLGGSGQAAVQLAPRPVKTDVVKKHKIGEPVEQVADVIAGTKLDIVPKVSGEVKEVLKKRGEYVQKGEVLFLLDSSAAESARQKSELALRNARQTLQQTRDNLANNRQDLADVVKKAETAYNNTREEVNKLRNEFQLGQAVQRQVDLAEQSLDQARMALDSTRSKLAAFDKSDPVAAAEIQVESARITLEDTERALQDFNVKAPGGGILTDFNLTAGQMVSAAAGPVGQVQQVDPVKMKTELSEALYNLVKGKQELVYYHPDAPERKETARISYLAPVMSAMTKTYTLELAIANPDLRIQPGKRYMVQLTTESEEQVPAVPILSIIREESDTYVYVLQGDHYQKRKVRLGRISGEYQEVLEGVKEGEPLVTVGQNTLKDGQKAEPTPSPAASSPAAPAQTK